MNVSTISMDKNVARKAFLEYRNSVRARHNAEDEAIMKGYRELSLGRQIIDINESFLTAGVDELGRPKIAICRATEKHVHCELFSDHCLFFWGKSLDSYGWRNSLTTRSQFKTPLVKDDERRNKNKNRYLKTIVPNIPPQFRPARGINNLYILWEVDKWNTVPVDPLLLRRLGGNLFVVLAQWDLTPIERSVLSGTRPL